MGPGSQVALEERDLDLSQGAGAELMTKLRTAEEEDLQATQAGSSRTDFEPASVVALVEKARG